MKFLSKIKRSILLKASALITIIIIITCCGTVILEVNQPTEGQINVALPIHIRYRYKANADYQNMRMVFAILVPKGWDAKNHTTITYESPKGNGTLTVMPDNIIENATKLPWAEACMKKFGLAGNFINDLEWVVFRSSPYTIDNGNDWTDDINITITPGADDINSSVRIAYVLSNDNQGLSEPDGFAEPPLPEYYHQVTGPCLTLSGSVSGEEVDFCNVPVASVDPSRALIDDFLTFSFLSAATSTPLDDATSVYLVAEAETSNGNKYKVDGRTDKNLTREESGKIYRLTIWPRSYFNIPAGETITTIRYHFEDQDGDVAGLGGGPNDIEYKLRCK